MTQENLIHNAESAIFSILHQRDILNRFHAFSYDESIFKQGESLCQKYSLLHQQHMEGQHRAQQAGRKLKEARKHLKLRYMRHLSMARLTFKDIPEHWEKLGLNSERYPDMQSWIKQAQRFYYHAKPIGELNTSYGIARQELEEANQILSQMAELSHLRKQAMSHAQTINQQKQECYVALGQWMQKFSPIARQVLAHEPEMLESFGLLSQIKNI